MKKRFAIYKITNLRNHKVYIGKTNSFRRRLNEYRNRKASKSRRCDYVIMKAIEKYGFEYFMMEVIYVCKDKKEMYYKEFEFIEFYESYNPKKGYNSMHMKAGKIMVNNKTRQRMKEAHIGLTETSITKKKKSKKIIIYDNSNDKFIISDSSKLFAERIDVDKSMVVNAMKHKRYFKRQYFIYYYDNELRSKIEKSNCYEKYNTILDRINNSGVETIESMIDVDIISYK